MKVTLIAITTFLIAVTATFIWFVVTWDPSKEEPVSSLGPIPTIAKTTVQLQEGTT